MVFWKLVQRMHPRLAAMTVKLPKKQLATLTKTVGAAAFVFHETTLPNKPEMPLDIPRTPPEELTNEFLIRQAAMTSAESGARLLTFLVTAVDDSLKQLVTANNDLANLYELSANYTLTEEGESKMVQLRHTISVKKKEILDLELLFEYVKKLMDANAEVNFLIGSEFSSLQTSERIHAASEHLKKQLEALSLAELDLAAAHKSHIEKLASKMSNQMAASKAAAEAPQETDNKEGQT